MISITDAAPNMVKATKILRKKHGFRKTQSVTCVAHGISNVIKQIRECHPHANELILSVKQLFHNSPKRVNQIKKFDDLDKTTKMRLKRPPSPVITRWSSWMDSVPYYSDQENIRRLKNVVTQILHDEMGEEPHKKTSTDDINKYAKFEKVLNALDNPLAASEIKFLNENLLFVSYKIKKLQNQNISLKDAVDVVEVIESVKGLECKHN